MPRSNQILEALEARRLLAFTGAFTDTDGDAYTVEVLGAGTAVVTTQDSGVSDGDDSTGLIQHLSVTGTSASSRLRINVTPGPAGDGRVRIGGLDATIVRSAKMPAIDSTSGGTLIFEDVGQLEFGDTSATVDLDVGVGAPAVNLGTRTITLGQVNQANIHVGPAVAKVTIDGSNLLNLTLDHGAGVVTSAGAASVNLTSAASIKELRIAGQATLRGTVSGDLGKLTAASMAFSGATFRVTGVLGNLSSPGVCAASVSAGRFGSIKLGSIAGGELLYTTPDAKGVVVSSLKVGDATEASIGPDNANGGVRGRIKSFAALAMSDSEVAAASIASLKVQSTIANSSLTLSDPAGSALGVLTVGGEILGTDIVLEDGAGIGTLKALSIATFDPGGPGESDSEVSAGFIGSLSLVSGLRNASINLAGAAPGGFALRSADFGEGVFSSSVIASGPSAGAFGALRAVELDTHDFRAPRINSVLITGRPDGIAVQNGILLGTSAAVGGFSVGTITLRGAVIDTLIASLGSIKSFAAASMSEGTRVRAGHIDFDAGFPADLSQYNPDAHIKSVSLTKPFLAAPAFALNASVVVAPTIDSISVKGLINTTGQDDFGQAFGFGARVFGKVTIKDASGQTVKPTIPSTPGVFNPFLPASAENFLFLTFA